MISESRLVGITASVYEAAYDARRWPAVLAGLSTLLNATGTILFFEDTTAQAITLDFTSGLDEGGVADYRSHYVTVDIRLEGALRGPVGSVFTDETTVPADVYRSSEVYNDFFAPWDSHHAVGSILLRSGAQSAIIGVQRSSRRGPFSTEEIRICEMLFPHVGRALEIHGRLAEDAASRAAELAVLDRLHSGVIVVGANEKVLLVNKTARALLAAHRLTLPDLMGHLRPAIARVTAVTHTPAAPPADVDIGAARGTGHLIATVGLLETESRSVRSSKGSVAIFLDDPNRAMTDPQRLEEAFGFTGAESRVAMHLLQGLTVSECAAALGCSAETVRKHLRRLFDKTGVRRQAELVLLLRTCGP